MKWIGYLFSSLWRLWFLIVFILVFIAFMPALFFFTAIKKDPIAIAHLARYWSKLTLWLSFIFPVITLDAEIDVNKKYIFCSNHVSTLDIPLVYAGIHVPLQYIGKIELTKLPLFGYFYKHNSIIVNRKNKKDAYASFVEAGKKLNNGLNVCIFPEGGIPKSNIFLKKFKNGAFKLAIEKDIHIIPITILDNKRVFPLKYFKGRPGIVRITIHKAIDPNKLEEKTIENLNVSTYNIIFDELKNYG